MPRITGIKQLRKTLKELQRKSENQHGKSVVVGYTAAYALYVHESVGMVMKGVKRSKPSKGHYWDPQGRAQAKFLEQPAREMAQEIASITRTAVERGATVQQGLYMAGLRLQRESQMLVPRDTGNLRASAFTEKE